MEQTFTLPALEFGAAQEAGIKRPVASQERQGDSLEKRRQKVVTRKQTCFGHQRSIRQVEQESLYALPLKVPKEASSALRRLTFNAENGVPEK